MYSVVTIFRCSVFVRYYFYPGLPGPFSKNEFTVYHTANKTKNGNEN